MKRKMKRLAVIGLAIACLLAGCNKVDEPAVDETPETNVEEPVQEPEKEKIPLSINVTPNSKTYYFENGEDAYLYLDYCDVTVAGDGYEKLKRSVESWSMERSEGLRSLYSAFEEAAREEMNVSEPGEFYGYSLYHNIETARADKAVVSLLEDTYQYTGGEHGMFYRDGINFDTKTGKRLKMADLFSDYDTFVEEAKERIVYELKEEYEEGLYEDYITTVEELWAEAGEPQWYLDASGIVIVFQEYMVGPYAMGVPEIHLPYTDFKPYMKEAYLPTNEDGIARIAVEQEVFLTLSDSAEEIPMMLTGKEVNLEMQYSLWLGQNEQPLGAYMAFQKAYLVRRAGETYCMVEVDQASDDYMTTIYRLTDGNIEKMKELYVAIDSGNINPHEVTMEFRVNLLGTYGGIKNYHFDESGKFVTEDTEFSLHRNQYVLTSKVDLPVTLEGMESTLPAGSHIVLNASDGETYVKFTIRETGQKGTLFVERDREQYYRVLVNGMDENECFEMLPYAG